MVTVYHDLDYEDFYKLIAGMDFVVPAFADFGCECRAPCEWISACVDGYSIRLRGPSELYGRPSGGAGRELRVYN